MAKTQARLYAELRRQAPSATDHEALVHLYLSRVRAAARWGQDGHGVYIDEPIFAAAYVETCGDLFGLVLGMVLAERPQLGQLLKLRPYHSVEIMLIVLRVLDGYARGWPECETTKRVRSELGV